MALYIDWYLQRQELSSFFDMAGHSGFVQPSADSPFCIDFDECSAGGELDSECWGQMQS